MKNCVSLISAAALALAFAFPAHSQTQNLAIHKYTESAIGLVRINSRLYYIESAPNKECCDYRSQLNSIDEKGAVAQGATLLFGPWNKAHGLYSGYDGNLFVHVSAGGSCGLSFTHRLIKIDTAGNLKFNMLLSGPPASISHYKDSLLFVALGTTLYRYSGTGQLISQMPAGAINGVSCQENGNVLLSYYSGGAWYLSEHTISENLISKSSVPNSVKKILKMKSGGYVAIGNKQVQKFSANLAYLKGTDSTLPAGYSVVDYDLRNDSIFITGADSSGGCFYSVLDANLNPLHVTVSNCKRLAPVGIALMPDNKIGMLMNGSSSGTNSALSSSFVTCFFTSLTGTIDCRYDIGVKNISIRHAYYQNVWPNFICGFLNLDVTVKNYGSDSVHGFHLNYVTYTMSPAVHINECKSYLNLSFNDPIPPGGEVTVNTGIFNSTLLSAASLSIPSKVTVCLFTTIPGNETDANADNDYACDTSSMVYVSISEEFASGFETFVYPSPAQGRFKLYYKNAFAGKEQIQYVIRDGTGKELLAGELIPGQAKEIDGGALSSGIYFITLSRQQRVMATKKLVITN